MNDFECRRNEFLSREQLISEYEDTLAVVQQRYDELSSQNGYVARKKVPNLEHRLLLLEDIILDLYTALRCLK